MYLQVIFLVMLSIITTTPSYTLSNDWYELEITEKQKINSLVDLSRAVEAFFDENYSYPNSIEELNNYASINGKFEDLFFYKKTTLIDEINHITYEKYLVAIARNNNEVDKNYFEYNQCGSEGFMSSAEFCGLDTAYWIVGDSRNNIKSLTAIQNSRLNETAQRFIEQKAFPASPTGKTISLEEAVGDVNCYSGNNFEDVTLSCLDIYSVTGEKVFYQYLNDKKSIIYVLMPFFSEVGEKNIIVKELNK
ncbi:hypothetical protein KW507_15855 [Vibrio fluvialis]|nr:hypothetical protein [Vibrio fluvialis]